MILVSAKNQTGLPETVKLVFVPSTLRKGRRQQGIRLRPSLMARVKSLAGGPMNLVIEHALERLCNDLEAIPEGSMAVVNASELDPTDQDIIECATSPGEKS